MATRKLTTVAATPVGSDVAEQPMFNNPVLTRRAPKNAISGLAMLVPLGAVIIIGAGYWAYTQMQPHPLMTDTAVATAPAAPIVQPVVPPAPVAAMPAQEAVAPPVTTPVAPPARHYAATAKVRAPIHHPAAAAASDAADTSATAPTSTDVAPPPASSSSESTPTITPPAPN